MVRNIIEDSDDEGDFGALSPIISRTASPTHVDSPNDHASARTQKSAPGTSSTDRLRRDIAAAHRDVIEKSALPNGTANSLDGSDRWSSPATSRKRKSATSSLETRETPPKKTDRKKTTKTYGQPDRRSRDLFDEDNGAFEAMRREEEGQYIGGFNDSTGQSGGKGPPLQTLEDGYMVHENQSLLPGSLQDEFAQHEPAVMFPTMMSSTVPDATITQQRLLEAARAEFHQDHHVSPSGFTTKIIENPSVSWSEYLESTEKAMESSQHGSVKSQQPPHSQKTDARSPSVKHQTSQTEILMPPYNGRTGSPVSVWTAKASQRSKTTAHRRLSQSSHDELSLETSSPATGSSRRKRQSLDEATMTSTQKVIDESVKESIRAVRASKAARTKDDTGSETLNSDDVDTGLPKERYVPRPSRSRSALSIIEEPDYSVRPEKTAKENAARRKASKASTPTRRKQTVKEKVKEMVSMGYTTEIAKKTLKQHGNDLESAVQSLLEDASNEANVVNNGTVDRQSQVDQPQAEKAATAANRLSATPEADMLSSSTEAVQAITPNQPKRKRGRPPKNRPQEGVGNTILMEQRQISIEAQYFQTDDIDELQQVMPPVNHTAHSEKDVTQVERLLHDPGFEEDTTRARRPSPIVRPTPTSSARPAVEDEMQHVEESKPKKRGRGRPRSTQKLQEAAAIKLDESRVPIEDHPHEENGNSQETQPNTSLEDGKSDDNQKAAQRGEEAILGAPPNATTALGPRSSEQPSDKHEVETDQKAAAKARSAQPSPLGQGKVPVRVGLSRRARIAPLLKIVKK